MSLRTFLRRKRIINAHGRSRTGLEPLEPRLLMAGPGISGAASAVEGAPYTLTLSPNDAADIQSWTINWGDGYTDIIPGDSTTAEHFFEDGPNRFVISATAQSPSQTYNAGSIGSSIGVTGAAGFGTYGGGRGGLQIDSTNASPTTFESILYPDGRFLQVGTYHYAPFDAIQLTRHLTNGAPDPSFDTDGKVLGLFNINAAFASGVALQPDGKILVSASIEGTYTNFSVIRFNSDGSLDSSFGSGGMVTYDYAGEADAAEDILFDPATGRILVGGDVRDNGFYGFAVLALEADGDIDTSFGDNGWATYQYPGTIYTAGSVLAFDDDGNILIAGHGVFPQSGFTYRRGVIARFTPQGDLDASFGIGGAALLDFGYSSGVINDMVLLPDDRIALAGSANTSGVTQSVGFLALFTSEGDLDPVFGRRAVDFNFSYERLSGLVVDPQGRLVAGGSITTSGDTNFLAVRFSLAGVLDPTFGDNGKLAITFPTNPPDITTDEINDVLIDPHGNITLVGTEFDSGPQFAFLAFARLTPAPGGVFVQDAPPALSVSGPSQHVVNTPYMLDFSALDAGNDSRKQWRVDWGDGVTSFLSGSASSATYTYTATRNFTITVTAVDEDGSHQANKQVSITHPPPAIDGNGVLHITGREITEAIGLSVLGEMIHIVLGTLVYDVPAAQVQSINFRTGGGNDTVVINAGIPGGNYTIDPSSNGIVNLTLKSGLKPGVVFNVIANSAPVITAEPNLGAIVSIFGPGSPKLRLLGTPGDDTFTLGLDSLSALGNTIAYHNLTSFIIESGDGDDTVTTNLPTPTSSPRFIGINAGAGDDLIQLLSGTFNPQNSIDGGDGDDRFEIHDGIRGAFAIGGDAGIDTLIFEGTQGPDLFLPLANGIDLAGNLLRDVFLRTSTPDRISTTEFVEIHGLGGDDVVTSGLVPPGFLFVGGPGSDTFNAQYPPSTPPVTYTLAGDILTSTFGLSATIDAETLRISSLQAAPHHLIVNDTPAFDVRLLPNGPASLTLNGGTFTCIPDGIRPGTAVVVNSGATLRIDSSPELGPLFLNTGGKARLTPGGNKTLFLTGLTIAEGAQLDLTDGDLVASVFAGEVDAILGYLTDKIRLGRGPSGDWDGTEGITSSSARDDQSGLTGLAIVPTATGARIKYSWAGDANADGRVNKDDFVLIDRGFLDGSVLFHQGNFDFNDTIDLLDYILIDLAFLGQSGVL